MSIPEEIEKHIYTYLIKCSKCSIYDLTYCKICFTNLCIQCIPNKCKKCKQKYCDNCKSSITKICKNCRYHRDYYFYNLNL